MKTVKINLHGKEVTIPEEDKDWFLKEAGAKLVNSKSSNTSEKEETEKNK